LTFLPAEEQIELDKHFEFAYQINVLTIVQSACFLAIALLVWRMASKSAFIFRQEHYGLMFKLVFMGLGALFFLPLFGIFTLSYYHGSDGTTTT